MHYHVLESVTSLSVTILSGTLRTRNPHKLPLTRQPVIFRRPARSISFPQRPPRITIPRYICYPPLPLDARQQVVIYRHAAANYTSSLLSHVPAGIPDIRAYSAPRLPDFYHANDSSTCKWLAEILCVFKVVVTYKPPKANRTDILILSAVETLSFTTIHIAMPTMMKSSNELMESPQASTIWLLRQLPLMNGFHASVIGWQRNSRRQIIDRHQIICAVPTPNTQQTNDLFIEKMR